MTAKEIKALSTEAIATQLVEAQKQYQSTQLVHSISPLESPIQIRKDRRVIARLATELHNRKINS